MVIERDRAVQLMDTKPPREDWSCYHGTRNTVVMLRGEFQEKYLFVVTKPAAMAKIVIERVSQRDL